MNPSNYLSILDILIENGVFTREEVLEHLGGVRIEINNQLLVSELRQIIREELISFNSKIDRRDSDELLTDKQLAVELNIKPKTLANWRNLNVGPAYIKERGVVRYRRADVNLWQKSKTNQTKESLDAQAN